jgi:FixJ family two-component response regulator
LWDDPVTPLLGAITAREERVLLLIADDWGLREIARELGITERQARRARDSARAKLGRATTAGAVADVVRLRASAGT